MSLSRCFRDLTDPSAVAVGKQERNGDRGVPSFNFPDSAMSPILAIGSLPVLVTVHLTAIQGVHGHTASKFQRLAGAVTPWNVLSDSLERNHGSGRGRAKFEIPGQVGQKSKGDFRWRRAAASSPRQFGQDRSRTTAKNDRKFGSPSKHLFLHITPQPSD